MKKKILALSVLVMFSGMSMPAHASDLFKPNAIIYDTTVSLYSKYFDGSVRPIKKGEAECTSYFSIVSIGKCGIKDAMDDGNITKVNSIDKENKNILLYQKTKVVVYGE